MVLKGLMHIYLELCHVIPDELNLMLKVMDVPIQDISQPAYSCALYSSIGCYYLTFDNSIGDITYSVNIGQFCQASVQSNNARICVRAQTVAHTQTNTYTKTHMHTNTTLTYTHTNTHTLAYTNIHTYQHTHALTHTLATYIHTQLS